MYVTLENGYLIGTLIELTGTPNDGTVIPIIFPYKIGVSYGSSIGVAINIDSTKT